MIELINNAMKELITYNLKFTQMKPNMNAVTSNIPQIGGVVKSLIPILTSLDTNPDLIQVSANAITVFYENIEIIFSIFTSNELSRQELYKLFTSPPFFVEKICTFDDSTFAKIDVNHIIQILNGIITILTIISNNMSTFTKTLESTIGSSQYKADTNKLNAMLGFDINAAISTLKPILDTKIIPQLRNFSEGLKNENDRPVKMAELRTALCRLKTALGPGFFTMLISKKEAPPAITLPPGAGPPPISLSPGASSPATLPPGAGTPVTLPPGAPATPVTPGSPATPVTPGPPGPSVTPAKPVMPAATATTAAGPTTKGGRKRRSTKRTHKKLDKKPRRKRSVTKKRSNK
jgi:hypothetical protein